MAGRIAQHALQKKYCIGYPRLRAALAALGLPRNCGKRQTKQRGANAHKAVLLRKTGMPLVVIAHQLGISRERVRQLLAREQADGAAQQVS